MYPSNHNFVRQKYAILTDLYIQIFFLDLCMLREIITNDWYVGFCLFSLVIVVSAKKIDSQRFSGFLKLFSNSNYLRIYLKEHTFFDSFDTLLFINFCVNIICFSWIGYQLLYTNVDMSFLLLSQLFPFVAGGVAPQSHTQPGFGPWPRARLAAAYRAQSFARPAPACCGNKSCADLAHQDALRLARACVTVGRP